MVSSNTNPVVIVTGANAGVGFGICQRLLLQCASSCPPDALLHTNGSQAADTTTSTSRPKPVIGLTLILACRNASKAQAAKKKLLKLLDAHLESHRGDADDDRHGDVFRDALRIHFVKCDLSSSSGVFEFCEAVDRSYSYVSHIVCNAGVMDFSHMVHWLAAKQFITDFFGFVTYPYYKLQHVGSTTEQGLGWTFQCNLFGHYIMARQLDHVLRRAPTQARVMWTSSLDAYPGCFDINDWQCIKSNRSYEGTKYATDLLVMELNRRASSDDTQAPRNIVIHPGITLTEMITSRLRLAALSHMLAVICMFIARWLGSVNHPIHAVKGAISASFAVLAPSSALPSPTEPVKVGSRATRGGRPYVGLDQIEDWPARQADAAKLVQNCEGLYDNMLKKRKAGAQIGNMDGR